MPERGFYCRKNRDFPSFSAVFGKIRKKLPPEGGGKTPKHFGSNIRAMVTGVREACPDCEIILVATSLPNPILTDPKTHFWGNQQYFLPVPEEIATDPAYVGHIAVANITGLHRYLLTKKRFLDLTANNANHPNDFFYRCYAQFLAGMLT